MEGLLKSRRFWQLFLRRFVMLLLVSLGLVGVLYFEHAIPYRPPLEWAKFIALDVVALVAASGLTSWLRLVQQEQRDRR
jgi:hypothetical protein